MIGFEARVRGTRLPPAEEVMDPALEAAITEATMLMEREVKIRTPIGVTEAARGSIAGEVRRAVGRGNVVARGVVGSPLVHVEVLERGRRPGSTPPPSDALELWVRRKLGITNVDEAKRVAFLVARAIGRKGTKAVAMFEHAAREKQATLERIFDQAGVDVAIRIVRGAK